MIKHLLFGVVIGLLSHLALDLISSGEELFAPVSQKNFSYNVLIFTPAQNKRDPSGPLLFSLQDEAALSWKYFLPVLPLHT